MPAALCCPALACPVRPVLCGNASESSPCWRSCALCVACAPRPHTPSPKGVCAILPAPSSHRPAAARSCSACVGGAQGTPCACCFPNHQYPATITTAFYHSLTHSLPPLPTQARSRSFVFHMRGGRSRSTLLVPLIDLANHSPRANCDVVLSPDERRCVCARARWGGECEREREKLFVTVCVAVLLSHSPLPTVT